MSLSLEVPKPRKWPIWLSLSLLAILVSLFIFIALRVREKRLIHTDLVIIDWVRHLQSPFLDKMSVIIAETFTPSIVALFALFLGLILWYLRRRQAAVFTVIAIGGALFFAALLKIAFARDRPDLWVSIMSETGYSFPSGHATASSALGFAAIVLLWNTVLRWYAVVVIGLFIGIVGFSRVYLGVHYPTDIVGAWSLSCMCVIVVKIVTDYLAEKFFYRQLS